MSDTCACGCRGARSCLLCERDKGRLARNEDTSAYSLYQCHNCGKIGPIEDCEEDPAERPLYACREPCRSAAVLCSRHTELGIPFDTFEGVTVVKDFLSQQEEATVVSAIDSQHWASSQSGRRKQDYGPKVNFKWQKLKLGSFCGLPPFSRLLVERMRGLVDTLADFTPVELCNLDYQPERGAHIEAHRDDSWLWGERLVTVNLLSPVLLTFTYPHSPPPPSSTPHHTQPTSSGSPHSPPPPSSTPHTTQPSLGSPPSPPPPSSHVHIPLPPRSLVVVQGPARHSWLHSILSRHVISRRVGITLRELSNKFLAGGKAEEMGGLMLEIARQFKGTPTNQSVTEH